MGIRFPERTRGFSLLHSAKIGCGAHSTTYKIGTDDSFPEEKQPEHESDSLSASSAKVKNLGAVPPLPVTPA
jgi:hypothetical protein